MKNLMRVISERSVVSYGPKRTVMQEMLKTLEIMFMPIEWETVMRRARMGISIEDEGCFK